MGTKWADGNSTDWNGDLALVVGGIYNVNHFHKIAGLISLGLCIQKLVD